MPASSVGSFDRARLTALRTAKGLSKQELAHLVGEKVSRQTIYKYEAGYSVPSPGRVLKLAQALEAHPAELIGADRDNPTLADLRIFHGLEIKALAAKAGLRYEGGIVHLVDRGLGPEVLSDDMAERLAAALETTPEQVRAAYERSRGRARRGR
jgi:DNA-binding XRE family transcriptional regulator